MYLKVFKYHLPALVIIGVVALIGYYAYPHLPDLIPTHFDIAGNPDHYSEKGTFGYLFFVLFPAGFFRACCLPAGFLPPACFPPCFFDFPFFFFLSSSRIW